jgi:hypothetical protein
MHQRPFADFGRSIQRCGAAFALRPFVHGAAFLSAKTSVCGQTRLVQLQLLLMQKLFAFAASLIWRVQHISPNQSFKRADLGRYQSDLLLQSVQIIET